MDNERGREGRRTAHMRGLEKVCLSRVEPEQPHLEPLRGGFPKTHTRAHTKAVREIKCEIRREREWERKIKNQATSRERKEAS